MMGSKSMSPGGTYPTMSEAYGRAPALGHLGHQENSACPYLVGLLAGSLAGSGFQFFAMSASLTSQQWPFGTPWLRAWSHSGRTGKYISFTISAETHPPEVQVGPTLLFSGKIQTWLEAMRLSSTCRIPCSLKGSLVLPESRYCKLDTICHQECLLSNHRMCHARWRQNLRVAQLFKVIKVCVLLVLEQHLVRLRF